jgi:hypothetical protein
MSEQEDFGPLNTAETVGLKARTQEFARFSGHEAANSGGWFEWLSPQASPPAWPR